MEKFGCIGSHGEQEADLHTRAEGEVHESFSMDCLTKHTREEGRILPSHHPLLNSLKFYTGMRDLCKPKRKKENKCASE